MQTVQWRIWQMPDTIQKMRDTYEDLAVVCYINSTAELKTHSDVCVTSANAVKIVKELPNKNIFFIPDRNLAHFVAEQVPEKNFVYNEGYCPIHETDAGGRDQKSKGTASECRSIVPSGMSESSAGRFPIM